MGLVEPGFLLTLVARMADEEDVNPNAKGGGGGGGGSHGGGGGHSSSGSSSSSYYSGYHGGHSNGGGGGGGGGALEWWEILIIVLSVVWFMLFLVGLWHYTCKAHKEGHKGRDKTLQIVGKALLMSTGLVLIVKMVQHFKRKRGSDNDDNNSIHGAGRTISGGLSSKIRSFSFKPGGGSAGGAYNKVEEGRAGRNDYNDDLPWSGGVYDHPRAADTTPLTAGAVNEKQSAPGHSWSGAAQGPGQKPSGDELMSARSSVSGGDDERHRDGQRFEPLRKTDARPQGGSAEEYYSASMSATDRKP